MAWALEDAPDVPPELVSLLLGLANHADRDGRHAYPSVATLCTYVRKGERIVRRQLRDLEVRGLIRQGDQRVVQHLPPGKRTKVWDLAMASKPLPPPPPDDDTPGPQTTPTPGLQTPGPQTTPGLGDRTEGVHRPPKPSLEPSTTTPVGTEGDGSARETEQPPRDITAPSSPPPAPTHGAMPAARCPLHLELADAPPCGKCADARRAQEQWKANRDAVAARARAEVQAEIQAQREAERQAIADCSRCDDRGISSAGVVCTHDQDADHAPGRAAFRALREQLAQRAAERQAKPEPATPYPAGETATYPVHSGDPLDDELGVGPSDDDVIHAVIHEADCPGGDCSCGIEPDDAGAWGPDDPPF